MAIYKPGDWVDPNDPNPVDANGNPVDERGNPLDLGHSNSGYLASHTGYNTPGEAVSGGLRYISPDVVNDIVDGIGGGGDDWSRQVDLAKEATAPSSASARQLYEESLRQLEISRNMPGASPIVAGQIQAPEDIEAGRFRTEAPSAAIERTASLVQGYTPTDAMAFDSAGRQQQALVTEARQQAPASVSGVNTGIAAPQLGDAAQTGGVQVERVAAPNTGDALRDEQIKAARAISSAPSAAMSQFRGAQAQNVADALSVAAAARGSERAGARREAMIQATQQGAQAGLSTAALAAQEEQAKRVAASGALSGIRGADITTATTGAQIAAQQANLQAQLDAAIAQGNTEAVNAIRTRQAELALEARRAEVAGGLTQQQTQAELARANLQAAQEVELRNAGSKTAASSDWAKAYNDAIAADMAAKTAVSTTNAAERTAAARYLAEAGNVARASDAAAATDTSRFNATQQANVAQANADRMLKIEEGNRSTGLDTQATNIQNTMEAQKATAANTLTGQAQSMSGASQALGAGNVATGTMADTAKTIVGANQAQADASSADKAAKMSALGTVAAAAISDERAKVEISPIGSGGPATDDLEERQRRNRYSPEQSRDTAAAFEQISTSPSTPPTAHNRSWAEFYGQNASLPFDEMMAAYEAKKAAERGMSGPYAYSDERIKQQVDKMDSQDIQDWAASIDPITFWYKPGYEDGGEVPHIGLSAQDVERSGALGKMMVRKDDEGMRGVDYTAATLMLSKAAFDKAVQTELALKKLAGSKGGR